MKDRQFNLTGIFIISSLLIGTAVDLLSENAERMLWNQIYLSGLFTTLYLVSIIIKKPLALLFSVDYAYLSGYPREDSKQLFNRTELFKWFQALTLLFVVRGIVQIIVKTWLLLTYGADSYGSMIIYLNIVGWLFTSLVIIGYIGIIKKINSVVKRDKSVQEKAIIKKQLEFEK